MLSHEQYLEDEAELGVEQSSVRVDLDAPGDGAPEAQIRGRPSSCAHHRYPTWIWHPWVLPGTEQPRGTDLVQRAPPLVRMWYRLGWGVLTRSFRLPRWITNLLLKCERNLGFSCCWVMRTTCTGWVSEGAQGLPKHSSKPQLAPPCQLPSLRLSPASA